MITIYFLSNFQVYSTVLLTIITMLYTRVPELIPPISGNLYPLTTFTYFPHPPGPHIYQSVSMSSAFFIFIFLIPRINEIIPFLSFSI